MRAGSALLRRNVPAPGRHHTQAARASSRAHAGTHCGRPTRWSSAAATMRSAQHALLPSPRASSGARSVRCCCRRVIRCPCHVPRPICRQAQVGSERVAGSRAGRARHASIGTSVLALPSIHPVMFRSLQVELARRPVSGTRDSSIALRLD